MNTVHVQLPLPGIPPVPLVLDSPHSGRFYPDDFGYACDFASLRQAEDTDVDDLFGCAPALGATLICAQWPRSYVDLNRPVQDIDISLIDGHWPDPIASSSKSLAGIGLIWRLLDDGTPIYRRQLSVSEVRTRIARCYYPYWDTLRQAVDTAYQRAGRVFHINCHSMPAKVGAEFPQSNLKPGTPVADVVLGDRDGSTCSGEFTELLARVFRNEGLSVAVNEPYKGVELVKQLGRPQQQRHSIQVEINRALYMNEATRERNDNYPQLKIALERVLRGVCQWIGS